MQEAAAAAAMTGESGVRQEQGRAFCGEDRISYLPDGARIRILSLLPVEDTVRTSVLSTRWRHLWTLAAIVIDDQRLREAVYEKRKAPPSSGPCFRCWFIQAMDDILARHEGPILGLHLLKSTSTCCLCTVGGSFELSFDEWVQTVAARDSIQDLSLLYSLPSRLACSPSLCRLTLRWFNPSLHELPALPPNLKELTLKASEKPHTELHALPQGVLACDSLFSLSLIDCDLKEPFGAQMPPNLRELVLYNCFVPDDLLPCVLSTCRLLDTLVMNDCYGLENVRINSSSLRKLTLGCANRLVRPWKDPSLHRVVVRRFVVLYYSPYKFSVEVAPNLEVLVLDSCYAPDSTVEIIEAPRLRFVSCDVNAGVKMLHGKNGSLMEPAALQTRELSVRVNIADAHQAQLLLDLMRCFPCLEVLDIEFSNVAVNPTDERCWEQENSLDCLDRHLKAVKIKGFYGSSGHQCSFVRYLIRNAKMLEVMSFFYNFGREVSQIEPIIQAELSSAERASDVRVMFTNNI